ncbi:MAG: hypothetical protein WBZ36_29390 [Candidatus Nitrosopolaris sp.]
MSVANMVELIGCSDTVELIDNETGKIQKYRTCVKPSFGVER